MQHSAHSKILLLSLRVVGLRLTSPYYKRLNGTFKQGRKLHDGIIILKFLWEYM